MYVCLFDVVMIIRGTSSFLRSFEKKKSFVETGKPFRKLPLCGFK